MTSSQYCSILETALLAFIEVEYPDGHRFQQDNDPKHTNNYTKNFLLDNSVNWWKTLAESPDLNPKEGINVCRKFIDHLYKVMPKVVEVEGAASGY